MCFFLSSLDERVLSGSVIWQADFLAFDTNQSAVIYEGYSAFVQDTKSLQIGAKTYQVDSCVKDCIVVTTTTPMATTANTGPNETQGGNKGEN